MMNYAAKGLETAQLRVKLAKRRCTVKVVRLRGLRQSIDSIEEILTRNWVRGSTNKTSLN